MSALKAWYAAEGSTAETTSAGAGLATERGPNSGPSSQRSSLAGMQPEAIPDAMAKPEFGVVTAVAALIKAGPCRLTPY
jgi:hypothetical protein